MTVRISLANVRGALNCRGIATTRGHWSRSDCAKYGTLWRIIK